MPRGSKAKYTDEQKRKAAHIEDSYEHKGLPKDEAENRRLRQAQSPGQEGPGPAGIGQARRCQP